MAKNEKRVTLFYPSLISFSQCTSVSPCLRVERSYVFLCFTASSEANSIHRIERYNSRHSTRCDTAGFCLIALERFVGIKE
jgi:hypothetical protein